MPFDLEIRDVMVEDVITVDKDYTVKYAAKIMNKCGISCVVVTENEQVSGVLTERDILKEVVASPREPQKTFVRDIMSTPVIVVNPKVKIEHALRLMKKYKIKKLPVIERSGSSKKLVGIVSLTDIARLQPSFMEKLRDMFAQSGETIPKRMKKVAHYYIV